MDATFINFLKAFTASWFTLMSGPLSVPLAIGAFFVPGNVAKAILAVTAVVCIVSASFSVWRRERQAVVALSARGEQREHRRKVRLVLAAFLSDGQELMQRCGDEKVPAPENDANEWAIKAEKFFSENMDDSFVARFRDSSGIPISATTIFSIPHRQLWSGIRVRVARLQEFIREFGDPG